MGLQLKSDGGEEKDALEKMNIDPDSIGGGFGGDDDEDPFGPKDGRKPDLSNLPPVKHIGGLSSSDIKVADPNRGLIHKIIGIIVLVGIAGAIYFGVHHFLNSGGKDISKYLGLSEEQIGKELSISFSQNDTKAKSIQQYSGGKVTVRSGKGLDIVYIDGKQVGVNTDSGKYRFFDVGIKDSQQTAEQNMTFKRAGIFAVGNDYLEGKSTSYFYYDAAKQNCLVLTVNNNTNRVVMMTYVTDFDLITRNLSFSDGDE